MSLTILHACTYNHINDDGVFYRVKEEDIWLTKRIDRLGNKHPSSYPRKFRLGLTHNPTSLEELRPIVEELGENPKALVIRGKYKGKKCGEIVLRQAKYVDSVNSHIVCLDIDEIPIPSHIDKLDIEAQGRYVCALLNECDSEIFPKDMGFIAQGSSSAGFSKNIKLHLWICNFHKVNQYQLRNLFYNVNTIYKREHNKTFIDTALYHDVQAHYTAYPIFEEGSTDPLKGKRTVYCKGNHSFIPNNYPKYVKPVETTEREQSIYVSSISGSHIASEILQSRIDVLKSWKPEVAGMRQKVIAAFHTAMQEQYCLKQLEKEILPYINYCRPGLADDYIKQGIVSAVRNIKACSYRSLPEESCGIPIKTIKTKKQKYLSLERELPKNAVTFLKATLGTGKTFTVQDMLAKGKIQGKFLAITDTSALVDSNTERFSPAADFRSLSGRLDFASGKVQRLSGTLHSLLKIRDWTDQFDFLFIDEADSLMNNLLFASIITEERKIQIIEVLSELLQNTDRVLISDGDLSEETVAEYIRLMDGSRDLFKIEHKYRNLENVTAYKHNTQGSLWGALEAHLSIGEKCLLVSDTSPDKLNEYAIAFNRILPSKNIKVVHSSSTMDEDIKDIIDNTTTALHNQRVDALLCSPSVTNGVDFNYFDTVFVLTCTDNHSPNMRFQAMMRERHPKTIHYYFTKIKGFITGYSNIIVDPGFTNRARQNYAARKEREYKTYIATFNYYLIDAGAKIVVIDQPYENPIDKIDKEQYLIEKIEAILRSRDGLVIKRHNNAYQTKQIIKYFYDLDEVTWDDVKRYLEEKPYEKMKYFHKLYKDYGQAIIAGDFKALSKELTNNPNKFYRLTGENLRHTSVVSIMKRCGATKNIIPWYIKFCNFEEGVRLPEELNEFIEPKGLV